MYSVINTAVIRGMNSVVVQVEADVCDGLPAFEMVGVPASEVREAKERVRSALRCLGYRLPPKKVTVNLCPADIPKRGTGFDLPIALAVLAAYGLLESPRLAGTLFGRQGWRKRSPCCRQRSLGRYWAGLRERAPCLPGRGRPVL